MSTEYPYRRSQDSSLGEDLGVIHEEKYTVVRQSSGLRKYHESLLPLFYASQGLVSLTLLVSPPLVICHFQASHIFLKCSRSRCLTICETLELIEMQRLILKFLFR
jgi:hypothetical protein